MSRKIAAALMTLTSAGLLGTTVISAEASTPVSPRAASACVQGYSTQDSARKITEHFTKNCAYLRVRAVVHCYSALDGDNTDYGGTINGTGYSSYKCNNIETAVGGNAQYYNGVKWVNLLF